MGGYIGLRHGKSLEAVFGEGELSRKERRGELWAWVWRDGRAVSGQGWLNSA
jgi:hypothetical protein